jgi:hypothetical protein
MSRIPEGHKMIAKKISEVFGGKKPPVTRYVDDHNVSHIDILRCQDSPNMGVVSYSTIGLSDHPLLFKGQEFHARVEIVASCEKIFADFENVLSTVAFCIINSKWFCAPGVIFPDVVSMYNLSETMADIYFCPPFLWDEKLKTSDIDGKKIAWLLAVPISKAESEYAQNNGPEKLESLFEKCNINIFDLNRPSVL